MKKHCPKAPLLSAQPILLEILPNAVNKAIGLKLFGQSGCLREQIMAIGDENNDMSTQVLAAMGNAPDAIKALADVTTTSNEEDGVA